MSFTSFTCIKGSEIIDAGWTTSRLATVASAILPDNLNSDERECSDPTQRIVSRFRFDVSRGRSTMTVEAPEGLVANATILDSETGRH
jgi:hypothetical protein